MLYNVIFRKLENNHQRLRDNEIKGWCNELPEIGECFEMLAPPKDQNMGIRCVNTSPVTGVAITEKDGEVVGSIFTTQSGSTYQVELLFTQLNH